MKTITPMTWAGWIIMTCTAAISMTATVIVFAYSTFETKEHIREAIIERLDRIESKLDHLIGK